MFETIIQFIRSVLPADPTQLIFLGGIVCLAIAPHLRWWPSESSDIIAWYSRELGGATRAQWWYFLAVVIWLFHLLRARDISSVFGRANVQRAALRGSFYFQH